MNELIEKLNKEFKDYARDDNGATPEDTLVDDFTDNYISNTADAMELLDKLGTCNVLDLITSLNGFYEDSSLMLDWMEDKQELANEIIGNLLRKSN